MGKGGEFMKALAKAIERFLYRDLCFITCGALELCAFACLVDAARFFYYTTAEIALGTAIAYVLGYTTQELLTLIGVVRTQREAIAPRYFVLLYRLWNRRPWHSWAPAPPGIMPTAKWILYTDRVPQRFRDDYERIESLKQIGTAIGPGAIVAGLLIVYAESQQSNCCRLLAYWGNPKMTGWLIFGVGVVLVHLGWMQLIRQREFLNAIFDLHALQWSGRRN
jgi:hypothetical protein